MTITEVATKISSYILYFSGLVGALTTAFGISQAIFSDKLVNVVSLQGNACLKSNNELSAWGTSLAESAGDFVYLMVDLHENPAECDAEQISWYPFISENEEAYSMALTKPADANFVPSMHIPVSAASEALLADGFLDYLESASLVGRGVFFIDLQDYSHTGPQYHLVPAPYSIETSHMLKCTASFNQASGWFARSLAFAKNCMGTF
ncbi:hypothetical protein [uncultured Tateyamaria sp.]|uniref:hypothetical protein n=1 Tax=uncultured Tateyamaria sp. TaxID=455651 RepID=UPI00261AEA39|nr:hypothetical protein [uncultured Tateyamaria sp.]